MSFYDPHGIRKNRKRYNTRKGQVIQAKLRDPPRCINPSLISTYGDYFAANPQYGLVPKPPINYPYPILGVHFAQVNSNGQDISFKDFNIVTHFQNNGSLTLTQVARNKTFAISYIKAPDGFFIACEGFNIGNNQTPITITPPSSAYLDAPFDAHSILIEKTLSSSHIYLCTFLFNNDYKPTTSIGLTGHSHDPRTALDLDTWTFIPFSIYKF